MWEPIASVPPGRLVQVAVISSGKLTPLRFPCRLSETGWVHAVTDEPIGVEPTHWREWHIRLVIRDD